jgi:phosphoesterase RecJ-like protein
VIPVAEWDRAAALLRRSRRLLIFAHAKPDADTIGSVLGLAQALAPSGTTATLVCAHPLGGGMADLPGAEHFRTAVPEHGSNGTAPVDDYDAIVAVDAATLDRLGGVYEANLERFGRLPVLNIDHHVSNPGFGSVNLVDPEAAAAAEVVTLLLEHLQIKPSVAAATCLMAGLLTDTLSFQTEGTTPRTLRVAASLVEAGAPLSQLAFRFFRQRSRGSALLWSGALSTLQFAAGGRVAWLEISRAVVAAAGPGAETTGLSGFAASIEGVEVGFTLEEAADGTIFVGLRSQTVDVAAVAGTFGGGGHVRAAGCHFAPPKTLAAARDAVLGAVEAALGLQPLPV